METAYEARPNLNDLDLTPEEALKTLVARWTDREPDRKAFADGTDDGYRRVQYRYVGGGGSDKHHDPNTIPPGSFQITMMCIPPGQGTTVHAHDVDEAFFLLKGTLLAIIGENPEERVETRLGPWDCICRPAGFYVGLYNDSEEPAYVQVVLPNAESLKPVAKAPHHKN